jgi:hypothetical protein
MRTKILSVIAGAASLVALAAMPAIAHHSFAAEFDSTKQVTLEGKVKEFRWVNPHSWLHINVANVARAHVVPAAAVRRFTRRKEMRLPARWGRRFCGAC